MGDHARLGHGGGHRGSWLCLHRSNLLDLIILSLSRVNIIPLWTVLFSLLIDIISPTFTFGLVLLGQSLHL